MDVSSPNPPETVIEMTAVSTGAMHDPNALAVEDVNWRVAAGDYWVVAGLHGSGKSDFLMMTAGLMPPTRGNYRLYGTEMPIFGEAHLSTRLRLGLVFDGGQLFNHLTLAENVALPLRYHRNLTLAEAEGEVETMLQLTELKPWANRKPDAVGRNWQKRAGLARALMLRPDVLLLDNPLTGLDLRTMSWWLNFLDQLSAGHMLLAGRSMTLIVTAADLRPWQGRARQFAVLKGKQFVVLGSRTELALATDPLVQEMLAADQPRS
jgi:ABC-type transporter Mla maintaining outer membrane lipid asymmetry ATPase subunit MlaF